MSLLETIYSKSPIFLQTFMLNGKAFELYLERYGKDFNRLLAEFEANEYRSTDEIDDYQNQRLRKLVHHAYEHSPYYNRLFAQHGIRPRDIDSKHDLHKIPILTKSDIKENFEDLIATDYPKSKLKKGNTSGTTGTPLNVLYDIRTCVVHHVADWRQKSWAGMKKGDEYASLQGRMVCPQSQTTPPFWRKNYINKQLFLSSFHLKPEYLKSYVEKLRKSQIRFIEGYPSTIYTLAAFLKATNEKLPMKAVLTSSETLWQWQKETIEDSFDCKVFDFYGMAERVVFASECGEHIGRHINEDYGITEIIDSSGNPAPVGTYGRLVATSIHNFAFPLIRYQTNDSCSLMKQPCPCGRTFPLMEPVTTKNEAIITLPDGTWISPSVLTHPFKPMTNIKASQIIQEDVNNLTIKIVRSSGYTEDDEKILRAGFEERLGQDVNVHIEYVETIPGTKSGKFKWVVSKVKPTFHTQTH